MDLGPKSQTFYITGRSASDGMGPEAWGSHICEDRENTKWPPNDLNIPRNYIKGSKMGESKNQENVKYGVGRVFGLHGSIRLVKLLCLLFVQCFLDSHGPNM